MQAHPGIVKHFRPIIDERAADESLAHHVGSVEHGIAIRIKLDEPQLMSGKLRALGVGHLVKRPGKWALGGSKCRRSERVLGGDIELGDLAGRLRRNARGPAAIRS